YLGMMCLGLFVGGIVTRGLRFMDNEKNFKGGMGEILGAALSGSVFVFIKWVPGSHGSDADKSVYAYPVGLVVALLWTYAPAGIKMALTGRREGAGGAVDGLTRALGIAHICALVVISFVAVGITLVPALEDLGWKTKPQENKPNVAKNQDAG